VAAGAADRQPLRGLDDDLGRLVVDLLERLDREQAGDLAVGVAEHLLVVAAADLDLEIGLDLEALALQHQLAALALDHGVDVADAVDAADADPQVAADVLVAVAVDPQVVVAPDVLVVV